jgi:hypothetical protein
VIGRLRHPRRRSAALAVFQIGAIPLIFSERFSTPGTSKYQILNRQPGYGRGRVIAGLACVRAQGCDSGVARAKAEGKYKTETHRTGRGR